MKALGKSLTTGFGLSLIIWITSCSTGSPLEYLGLFEAQTGPADKVKKDVKLDREIDEVISDIERLESEASLDHQVEMEQRRKLAEAQKIERLKKQEQMAKLVAIQAQKNLANANAAQKARLQKKLEEAQYKLRWAKEQKEKEEAERTREAALAKQALLARLNAIEEAKAKKNARALARAKAEQDALQVAAERKKIQLEEARIQEQLKGKKSQEQRIALQNRLKAQREQEIADRKKAEQELDAKRKDEEEQKQIRIKTRQLLAAKKAAEKQEALQQIIRAASAASATSATAATDTSVMLAAVATAAGIEDVSKSSEKWEAPKAQEALDDQGKIVAAAPDEKTTALASLTTSTSQPKREPSQAEKTVIFHGHRYIVRKGDTLESIARYVYGDPKWREEIKNYNRKFNLKYKLTTGMVLYMPQIPNKLKYLDRFSNHTIKSYQVKQYTTIWVLSRKLFGDVHNWLFLLSANPQIKDPYEIKEGTFIFYPDYQGE